MPIHAGARLGGVGARHVLPGRPRPHDEEALDLSARRLIAKSITMSAWAYKYSVHQPYVYPRNDVDYATNFLAMMFSIPPVDTKIDPTIAKALDLLFVLHADHEQNCSASTVRLVGSGGANLFSAVSAGIHARSGPLHGGANQEVVEMLQEMHEEVATSPVSWQGQRTAAIPFRLMGFGHRVYKNFDPAPRSSRRRRSRSSTSSTWTIRCSTWRWSWSK